jgi:hypothetical protein
MLKFPRWIALFFPLKNGEKGGGASSESTSRLLHKSTSLTVTQMNETKGFIDQEPYISREKGNRCTLYQLITPYISGVDVFIVL